MQKLNLNRYPSEILSKPTKEVTKDQLELVNSYLPQMVALMKEYKGVGLAANQAGLDMSFVILDLSQDAYYDKTEESPLLIINPKLISEKDPVRIKEGCLSLPGFSEFVTRPSEVVIEFMDKNGELKIRTLNGLMAQCAVHEINHLKGHLTLDEMSVMVKQMWLKKAKKYNLL